MKQSDKDLFVKLLELDPVHQDLAPSFYDQYAELERMCGIAGSSLSTKDKILFAFLWADESPVAIVAPEPKEIEEGDRVFFMWKRKKETLARLGLVVGIAGLSEKGKVRIKGDKDDKNYRELKMEDVKQILPQE